MEIYTKDFAVEYKDDKLPLTEADLKSNEIICTSLQNLYPNIPIMSEENKQIEYDIRKNWEYYWCIDPIDGTKEFIKKNGEFTVNIALIHKNTPVLGMVYAPAIHMLYYAKKGEGAYKIVGSIDFNNAVKLPKSKHQKPDTLTIVASKSHMNKETEQFINNLTFNIKNSKLISKGSSLKLCLVAEGGADIYPRLAPTMEWDTAASDTVIRELGKMTYKYHSTFDIQNSILEQPLLYNKTELLNPWFVVK